MEMLIARSVLDRIFTHVASDPAHEMCGLLFGNEGRIDAVRPTANIHPDPARHFEVDPVALIDALRNERNGGARLIGHYHSHPSGDVMPSHYDAQAADPGRLWLIVANREVGLFLAAERGPIAGVFHAVDLRVTP